MENETIEEAAKKIFPHHKGLTITASNKIMLRRAAFIKGVKWKEEIDKKVLDVCCGPRGMWFDKKDKRALFLDKRSEEKKWEHPSGNRHDIICPDIIGNFTDIKQADNSFYHIVFDPPHITQDNPTGRIVFRYGYLTGDWKEMLKKGFEECFRVLKPNGTLIFKWNECRVPIKEILALTDEKPLYGHKSGKAMQTHWICFIKK